ncbi:hypothetical protein BD410DRAFT_825569 [Rickenella mellea]|uniref:Exonuclease V n=1 Tax=Rickenella mellea TaxID=50990 RepID=A0A4Y7QHK8_9AGAM|nr:hypothetical protein BD410DRAFT_825569 [Rickenella mellea]
MLGDEFDDLEFPDFTEAELAQIDLLSAAAFINHQEASGYPQVIVELEQATDQTLKGLSRETKQELTQQSPYYIYRLERDVLSVTDLSAPAWCELQFDYGLRQKRSMPIQRRPKTFVTEKGKEIVVEKTVAQRNDRTQQAGKAVHKKLEVEDHGEPVAIKVDTSEERHALIVMDTMCRLMDLKTHGRCRELNVWGILHNQLIAGCIDEINRIVAPDKRETKNSSDVVNCAESPPLDLTDTPQTPGTKGKKRKVHDRSSPSPANNTDPADASSQQSPPKHVLNIVDQKTRNSTKLPLHEDTRPSRIQLMIYYRLLLGLISQTDQFDFLAYWARRNLDPNLRFSPRFISETNTLMHAYGFVSGDRCLESLEGLIEPFRQTIDGLEAELSKNLRLVYRRRAPDNKRRRVERLVQSSLLEYAVAGTGTKPDSFGRGTSGSEEIEFPGLALAIQQSLLEHEKSASQSQEQEDIAIVPVDTTEHDDQTSSSSTSEFAPEPMDSNIIGSKKFRYNEKFLEDHLTGVLQWWYGERQPQGVELEFSRRCNTCEYRNGCEWREAKAKEALSKVTHKEANNDDGIVNNQMAI